MGFRKVEVNRTGKWEEIKFMDLHMGDLFRMFEPTGEAVVGDKGDTEFIADSYPCMSAGNDNLMIDIK